MRDEPDVELVELSTDGPASAEPLPPPRPVPKPWAAVAMVVSAVLLATSITWLVLAGRPHRVTHVVTPTVASGYDAAGCPVTLTCPIDAVQSTAIYTAALQLFPDADVRYVPATRSEDLSITYRSGAIIRTTDGVVVIAMASCIPHGRTVPPQPASVGMPDRGPVRWTLVRPGTSAGSSVAVTVSTDRAVPIPWDAVYQLVATPDAAC